MRKLSNKERATRDKHHGIVQLYKTGDYTTEYIGKLFNVSVRQVQRIATNYGVIRTQAEANKVAAPLKHYHTVPPELRVKRKWLTTKKRYIILANHPYCANCGERPDNGVRLEVDHIDEDATNNEPSNLQVLCGRCNTGKSHLARFGA